MLRLAVLNHLLQQRADLRTELATQAGRTACLRVPPLRLTFSITPEGLLQASDAIAADASIRIAPWLLPRLAMHDPAAERDLQVSGDTQLAATVGRVLQAMDWDAEADLARLLGDIPAHRIASLARDWIGDPGRIARNLAETTAEYLQEEVRLLVPRPSVDHFVNEVDRLRDDVARLEKRIAGQTLQRVKTTVQDTPPV